MVSKAIPKWYRLGMTTQIAVRLPDDLVRFVDEVITSGKASSRAAVVASALERERRRAVAQRDAEILTRHGGYPDLDALARHNTTVDSGLD